MNILLISPRPETWNDLVPALETEGYTFHQVPTFAEAVRYIQATPPCLTILDLRLEGEALRKVVIDLLMLNASVHTAVVSDLEDEAFHEATEGLGILMPLPLTPQSEDIQRLLAALAGVL